MKKTATAEITDTIQSELSSSTPLANSRSLTDLCRKVPAVQYLLEEWHGSPFCFGVKNAESLAIAGFESVLNMKHAKMLRMLLKT